MAVTHCVGKRHSSLRIGLKVLIHTVGRNTKYKIEKHRNPPGLVCYGGGSEIQNEKLCFS